MKSPRFPSGLRIVTDAMAHLKTASLGVFVGAGSRHERTHEHGLSHLLEHMAFKGTRRRSARDIAEEIENAGGDLNAETSVEQTAYLARVLGEDVKLALDILADILTDSQFDAGELEREKGVILQEIGAVEDAPDDLIFDLFTSAAWPEQPIGRPILGTRERVSAFDRGAIDGYLRHHYQAGATIVTGAGAVEHAEIVDLSARRFEALGARRESDRIAGILSRRRNPDEKGARADAYRRRIRRPRRSCGRSRRGSCFCGGGRRRHVLAIVPGSARETRPRLFDLFVPLGLFGRRADGILRRNVAGATPAN